MMPQRNLAAFPAWNLDHARRQIPSISGRFPRRIGTFAPDRGLPNHSFDTRRTGTRFQLEAVPLGRGTARDAAGRAGSLRGPRRVFLCADSDRALIRRILTTDSVRLIRNKVDSSLGVVYKKITAKLQPFRLWCVVRQIGHLTGVLSFGVRPHECQIGSGEEFRPAVRVRHSRAAPSFWLAPSSIRPRARSWFLSPADAVFDSVLKRHRRLLSHGPVRH